MDFTSKVIIITGASEGIGLDVAKLLAAQGAKLVLAARTESKLHAAAAACGKLNPEAKILAVVTDVTKRADHAALLAETLRTFGKVDVLVNNAGRGSIVPALELTDADLDDMFLMNTKSALYGMQTVIPYFKAQADGGHVINVSSLLGRVPMSSARAAYSAAKHALNALTANVRVDLHNAGFDRIQVSLFSPGLVATDFGLTASGGTHDSKAMPGAQPPVEVAQGIVDMMASRACEAYSRPAYAAMIAGYYALSAEELAVKETLPPWRVGGGAAPAAPAAP